MRIIVMGLALCLFLILNATAAEGPIDRGSNFLGGAFIYSESGGDLYDNQDLSVVEIEGFYRNFFWKRVAIGAILDYSHYKHGDDPSVDLFSFGPTIACFFGKMDDNTFPFLEIAYTFDNNFYGSNSSTGSKFIIGGGVALRVTPHLAVYNELTYNFETIEGVSGRTFKLKIGLGGFLFKKYQAGSLALN